ncbi:MAG: Pyrrolo-quinoline quinone repeat-containing protein [Phycisphaerales bacterium]|nr:Pyrrolo-quinoline quinone repeat-containing protein [Phycisphaerales bacterium]
MQRPMHKRKRWQPTAALLLSVILIACAPRSSAAVVFAPPDDSVDAANELKSIEHELADRNYPAAAKRLDLLLSARGHPLASLSERTLTSVDAWVDHIPADTRSALAVECAKQMGAAARQALDSLRDGRATRPDEFYSLARRYPLTDAAGAALACAGDLALRGGDLPAAQAYYELALREQFPLGEDRERRLQFLKESNTVTAPPGAPDGAKPQSAGPLPFDATWFGNPSMMRQTKFFPAAYDDRILLASWKNVTMLREDGQVLWSFSDPKAPGVFSAGQGALFAPAALCDLHGQPAIIVVRQPGAQGDAQFVLRALRATDGKQLWSTDASGPRADLTYSGLPVVCGRYVYSVAVARTGVSSANFVLAALDVTTGQSLWQTTLGAVTEQGERGGADRNFGRKFGRNAPLSLDGFAAISEPAVVGDLVIVAPNCGSVVAVGRFDGNVRWVSAYRAPENAAQGGVDRNGRWTPPVEAERALLTRYRSTPLACGNVIVAMPQDAAALFAFDRATGRRLWETDIVIADAFGLAGASGNIAIACGTTLVGIDAGGTGKLKWKYTPARGIHLTGPAVVQGHTVLAPTTMGTLQLDAADGSEKPAYTVPSFRHLLTTDAGRSIATEAGAAATFGFSPTAR